MTLTKLQGIARVLANGAWTRYWINWNSMTWPSGELGSLMAIQCRDGTGEAQPIPDAARHGFTEHDDFIYTVPRTNEDGTRYINKH